MLQAGRVRALGTMSGTSLDGVDAAIVETDGESIFGFGPAAYRRYTDAEQRTLRAALGQWTGPKVTAATRIVEQAHLELLRSFDPVDLIGFHGQTLAHEPRGRGTLQIGDGALLARQLGQPVVWDFRSADVRLGGEGAPLAPFYHFALAKMIKRNQPLAFLNLGGVGNITWIDPRHKRPQDPGALLAFDTGPANAPINDLLMRRRGQVHDADGRLASAGEVNETVVATFMAHPFFDRLPPKSLDRDTFSDLPDQIARLSDADAAATLTACAASAVMRGMQHCHGAPTEVLVTGGGRHNTTLMAMLAAGLDCPVRQVDAEGLDGDMLEAQAFGFLAVRVARGLPTSCPGTTGVAAAVGGGTISRPDAALIA